MDEFLAIFTPLEWILVLGLLISSIALIHFYLKYYAPLARTKTNCNVNTEDNRPISVVISGKNEYENLKENLPFWLSQKYPQFEIVVVYDTTDDNLLYLLRDFQ
ncbi:MAG: hypothetical protein RR190_06680, partial [Bacteroidales bacterium]